MPAPYPAGTSPYKLAQENDDFILQENESFLLWDGTWDFYAETDENTGTDVVDSEGTDFAPPGFRMLRLSRSKYSLKLR